MPCWLLVPWGPGGCGGNNHSKPELALPIGRRARWDRLVWFHWAWCLEGRAGLGPPGGQQQAGGTRRRPTLQGVGPTSWAVGAAGPLPFSVQPQA